MARGTRRAAISFALVTLASIAAPAHAAGTLQVSSPSLAFGNVQLGEASPRQVVNVWNSGDAPATISSVSFTGSGATQFTLWNDTCSGQTVFPSTIGCSFAVAFAPTAAGSVSATVAIMSDGVPTRLDVGLDGTGTHPSLSGPSSLLFASSTVVGGSSEVVQAMFFNNGYGPVSIGGSMMTGSAPDQFAITGTDCPAHLPQSGFCSFSLRFLPTSAGEKVASLVVTSSAVTSPHVVSLSARAHLPIQAFPTSHQFGQQQIGTLSTFTLNVSVQNSSVNPVTIQSVSGAGAHPTEFPIGDACTGLTLQPNGFCSVTVGFRPAGSGARTASITITSNAPGGPISVSVSGVGVGPVLSVTPNPVAYAATELGTSRLRTVTIRNDGDGTGFVDLMEIVGPGAGEFIQESGTCSGANLFPAGGTCSVSIRYLPSAVGVASAATLRYETNAGVISVPLTGSGIDTTPPATTIDQPVPPVKASLLTSVTGVVDDVGGAEATTVVFEDVLLGNVTVGQATYTSCANRNVSCAWTVVVPVLTPGPYTVRAFSRDRNGNTEAPGDSSALIIV